MLLVWNDIIIDLLLANFQSGISKHSGETFFLEPVFVEFGNSGLEPVTLDKKETVFSNFGENLRNVRTSFLLWAITEKYLQWSFSFRRQSAIVQFYYICFSGYFKKFSMQLFQNILIKTSVSGVEFLTINLSPVL